MLESLENHAIPLQYYHVAADLHAMPHSPTNSERRRGFSLLEIVISVLIIGLLASIAIPRFMTYQYKAKSAEAKTNLGSIRVAEEAYYSEFEQYVSVAAEPAVVPGSQPTIFDGRNSSFAKLGFSTDGNVYFSYGVGVSVDRVGYSIDAGADIDEDGVVQFWGYTKPDGSGNLVAGEVGCDVAALTPLQTGPCDPAAGQTIF